MAKLFIVGANGYIGRNLRKYILSRENIAVVSVGRSNSDIAADLETGDFSSFLKEVSEGDYVILLAAISSPDLCARNLEKANHINVRNTITLISTLISHDVRVIFASSDVVFGKADTICADDSPLMPFGPYGEMKAVVESFFRESTNFKVVRFSYVLGMGDTFSQLLARSAKLGQVVEVFDGLERNVVSIFDVLEGIIRLIHHWDTTPQFFNFSGPQLISRVKLADTLSKSVFPDLNYVITTPPIEFWDYRPRRIHTTCQNFTNLLGRAPRTLQQIIDCWE